MTFVPDTFASHVPAWRFPKLRDALRDAELRGSKCSGDEAPEHRALRLRFFKGAKTGAKAGNWGRNRFPPEQALAIWNMVLQLRPRDATYGVTVSKDVLDRMVEFHAMECQQNGWTPAARGTLYAYFRDDPKPEQQVALGISDIHETLWERHQRELREANAREPVVARLPSGECFRLSCTEALKLAETLIYAVRRSQAGG